MNKAFRRILVAVLACAMLVSGMALGAGAAEAGTYNRVDEIQDWGAATTKLVVSLGQEVAAQEVGTGAFSVYVRRVDERLEESLLEEGAVAVTAAYVSDESGNRAADTGAYVTLETRIGPTYTLTAPLNYGMDPAAGRRFNAWIDCQYTITQQSAVGGVTGVVANKLDRQIVPVVDEFQGGAHSYNDPKWGRINLTYAEYIPETVARGQKPLVIWLHGGGEGGTDYTIPLSANRAGAIATPEIQNYFGANGAYYLAIQTPTKWMDDGKDSDAMTISESIYTGALFDLIDKYVNAHDDIDPSRVYIGGCSNGGFQTVQLLLANPGYFAAAYPTATPTNPELLTDAQIASLAKENIWFVHAKGDATVDPDLHTVPLYNRLIAAGAKNVHFTYLPTVQDESGLYFAEDGVTPHEYDHHWSWIYVYNDAVVKNGTSLWAWMAAQTNGFYFWN